MFKERMEIPPNTAFMQFLQAYGAAQEKVRKSGLTEVLVEAEGGYRLLLTVLPNGDVRFDQAFQQRFDAGCGHPVSDPELLALSKALRELDLAQLKAG